MRCTSFLPIVAYPPDVQGNNAKSEIPKQSDQHVRTLCQVQLQFPKFTNKGLQTWRHILGHMANYLGELRLKDGLQQFLNIFGNAR